MVLIQCCSKISFRDLTKRITISFKKKTIIFRIRHRSNDKKFTSSKKDKKREKNEEAKSLGKAENTKRANLSS